MRVCFFGAYDRGYPRNRILREGLRLAGVDVVEANVPGQRVIRRYPALLAAFQGAARASDVIFVPEFRHKDVPLARLLAGRRSLVFDPLVSRHDTLVDDWKLHEAASGQALWNRGIDRMAFTLPDRVLCDTWAHGAHFETLGARRAALRRILVGAEAAFFEAGEPPRAAPVRVIYLGGFLPLHGVPVLIEAAARLEAGGATLPDYCIELVGKGIEFDRSRELAENLALRRLSFRGATRYEDAPAVLAAAHVVLGAFGAGAKAGRVIPHKVYQGLASGRAVVTGDGEGVREIYAPGEHLVAVPRGDAAALAAALADVIADGALRARLGRSGRDRTLEVATPRRIGEDLADVLEECLGHAA